MSCRRLLRTVVLATLAFATAWGPSAILVASATFVSACGPSGSDTAVADREQSLADIARAVEGALNDSKADSPSRPTILGDIQANVPARGMFRPNRRYLGWGFSAEQPVPVSIRSKITERASASTFVQLLWHPTCKDPWRTVDISAGTLSRDLPTQGGLYLLVSGPRSTTTSGTLEALLAVSTEEAAVIQGTICPPGAGDRPPVPEPLDPEPTVNVGAIGARFDVTHGGSASYSIPLVVPPGRASIEPSLAITYDSMGGNGLLGIRFSLAGLSSIARCNRDLVRDDGHAPPTLDAKDAYCLDGARLVPRSSASDGAVTYSTESESYARITPAGVGPGGPESFKVEAKDGRILEYGTCRESS